MQKTLSIIALVLILVLGVFVGYWLRGLRKGPEVQPIVKIDTLVIHDTMTMEKPIPLYVRVVDTMRVPVIDTVHVRDSVFISIQREEKVYQDSTYRAVVSGYRPSLDSISVFQTTKYVTITKYAKKPWGVGVQAGVTYLPKVGFTPYVGLGISYNIINF